MFVCVCGGMCVCVGGVVCVGGCVCVGGLCVCVCVWHMCHVGCSQVKAKVLSEYNFLIRLLISMNVYGS